MSNLDAALFYLSKGYGAIPVRENKKPYIKWEEYQTRLPTEIEINRWWGLYPDANLGVCTGKVCGSVVIDCDSVDGVDALKEFLPDDITTPVTKSPHGWHYWFDYEGGIKNGVRVLKDCDVRSDGGYIIVPPSVNGDLNYSWIDGSHLLKKKKAKLPSMLASTLLYGKNNYICINEPNDKKAQQSATKRNMSLCKGHRDQSIFRIASHLFSSGMMDGDILNILKIIGNACDPFFPENEVVAKFESAKKRNTDSAKSLMQEIRDWISATKRNFSATFCYKELEIATKRNKSKARMVFHRLIKEGSIARGNRAGEYIYIDSDVERMDFMAAKEETSDIFLPFGLHDMIEIMPGNVILIAGEPNSGKTSVLLNIIKWNLNKYKIHYFNSEMGASELKKRLKKFDDLTLADWKFSAYERGSNFADVIRPGLENLNIIDFLEIHDNFWEIGSLISDIHQKLDGALCVIAMQKNRGTDLGRGGIATLEKPRLALSMYPGRIEIVKAKSWKCHDNPNGKHVTFKIVDGAKLIQTAAWERKV